MVSDSESDFEWREGMPTPVASTMTGEITSQWVDHLENVFETDLIGLIAGNGVRVISDGPNDLAISLLDQTMSSHTRLLGMLGPSAFESTGGDAVVLHFADQDRYYRYACAFYPEGEFGASAGMQIRAGYPHIVLWGTEGYQLGPTVAHELLHLAMAHRTLPLWLEEGMAQMFELDMGSMDVIAYRHEDMADCRTFWNERSLDGFWSGESFSKSEDTQKFAYLLAETLTRNLISEYGKNSWFKRKQPSRFRRFVDAAHYEDAGESAAQQAFGIGVEQIAEQFLGQPR